MQIEKIHICDWRNIEDTSADLAPLTIIRGKNHNGKSSVAQAIQIPLTTRADGTDAAGRGANDKIRLGAKKAKISLTLKGKSGPVPFEVTYGPGRTGRTITSESPAPFLKWLETNNERLSCCLDSEYFICQKAEDQKSILAGLVLPQTFEFPEAVKKAASSLMTAELAASFNWNANPVGIIDTLYGASFEARKVAKAALAANHIPELPATRPKHKPAEIEAKLAELRQKAAKLLEERPKGGFELGKLTAENQQVGGELFRAEAEVEELRTSIRDVESNILAVAQLKTYERVANQRRQFDNLQAQIDVIVQQIEDQRTIQGVWRDLLKQQTCPTCKQAVTAEFVQARIDEAQTLIDNKGVKQNSIMRDQRELGGIDEAERMILAHKEALGQKDTFQRELSDLVAKIANLKDRQRELKAKIIAAEGAKEDAAKPNPELDQVNQEIKQWEDLLSPAIRYDALVQQIEQGAARARDLSAELETLEKLVKYFGKDGVKAKLIQENIGAFQSTMNGVLRVWGYEATLSIEPYSFDVTQIDGVRLPLKELSGSEKLMFAVALQTAIAHHSKIGVVVVDKADTFINGERNRLFGALSTLLRSNVVEQAIVMVADENTQAPQKEGVVYFSAQAGKLVRL